MRPQTSGGKLERGRIAFQVLPRARCLMCKFLDARDFVIELYAFINSFVTVVLLWISHHDISKKCAAPTAV